MVYPDSSGSTTPTADMPADGIESRPVSSDIDGLLAEVEQVRTATDPSSISSAPIDYQAQLVDWNTPSTSSITTSSTAWSSLQKFIYDKFRGTYPGTKYRDPDPECNNVLGVYHIIEESVYWREVRFGNYKFHFSVMDPNSVTILNKHGTELEPTSLQDSDLEQIQKTMAKMMGIIDQPARATYAQAQTQYNTKAEFQELAFELFSKYIKGEIEGNWSIFVDGDEYNIFYAEGDNTYAISFSKAKGYESVEFTWSETGKAFKDDDFTSKKSPILTALTTLSAPRSHQSSRKRPAPLSLSPIPDEGETDLNSAISEVSTSIKNLFIIPQSFPSPYQEGSLHFGYRKQTEMWSILYTPSPDNPEEQYTVIVDCRSKPSTITISNRGRDVKEHPRQVDITQLNGLYTALRQVHKTTSQASSAPDTYAQMQQLIFQTFKDAPIGVYQNQRGFHEVIVSQFNPDYKLVSYDNLKFYIKPEGDPSAVKITSGTTVFNASHITQLAVEGFKLCINTLKPSFPWLNKPPLQEQLKNCFTQIVKTEQERKQGFKQLSKPKANPYIELVQSDRDHDNMAARIIYKNEEVLDSYQLEANGNVYILDTTTQPSSRIQVTDLSTINTITKSVVEAAASHGKFPAPKPDYPITDTDHKELEKVLLNQQDGRKRGNPDMPSPLPPSQMPRTSQQAPEPQRLPQHRLHTTGGAFRVIGSGSSKPRGNLPGM